VTVLLRLSPLAQAVRQVQHSRSDNMQSSCNLVRMLLRAKADPNYSAPADQGEPLDYAWRQGRLDCVMLLLQSKACPSQHMCQTMRRHRNGSSTSRLIYDACIANTSDGAADIKRRRLESDSDEDEY
jgi:ankyrin repeat protein